MAEADRLAIDVWQTFVDTHSGYQVIVEDNGRVAYAYLLNPAREIVSDVWLYNRCVTPTEPEWTDPDNLPFANPAEFARPDGAIVPIDREEDIEVVWVQASGVTAQVYIRNVLSGVLAPGARPGWSVMAAKDGPLARVRLL